MKTIKINTEKPYGVTIARGYKDFCLDKKFGKTLIVTDENVYRLYLDEVKSLFDGEVYTVAIKSGETAKSLEGYFCVLNVLFEKGFSRNDLLVCLGGGVVGDVGGFAASTYLRGISYIEMPTTLLSMIDSSVGGKTGINYQGVKNSIGSFYTPCYVYANLDTLNTLPKKEFENGKGELTKYSFLTKTVSSDDSIENAVYNSVKFKAEITEKDEKDRGIRTLLNLGHTVGHAVEELSNYTLSHGLCVFKGLYSAVKISEKLYGFTEEKSRRLINILNAQNADYTLPYKKEEILNAIRRDKKADGDKIRFVTVFDVGDCRIEELSFDEMEKLL